MFCIKGALKRDDLWSLLCVTIFKLWRCTTVSSKRSWTVLVLREFIHTLEWTTIHLHRVAHLRREVTLDIVLFSLWTSDETFYSPHFVKIVCFWFRFIIRLFNGQTFIRRDDSILLVRCLSHELILWFTISLISLSCPVKLIRKHIFKF